MLVARQLRLSGRILQLVIGVKLRPEHLGIRASNHREPGWVDRSILFHWHRAFVNVSYELAQ